MFTISAMNYVNDLFLLLPIWKSECNTVCTLPCKPAYFVLALSVDIGGTWYKDVPNATTTCVDKPTRCNTSYE